MELLVGKKNIEKNAQNFGRKPEIAVVEKQKIIGVFFSFLKDQGVVCNLWLLSTVFFYLTAFYIFRECM